MLKRGAICAGAATCRSCIALGFDCQCRSAAVQAMKITVKSYHEMKHFTDGLPEGGRMELAAGESVQTVLRHLFGHPEKLPELVLFVNGRMARPDTRLTEGDTLVFFSPVAGG